MEFLHKTAAGDMHSTGHEPYALHIIHYLHTVYNLYLPYNYLRQNTKRNILFKQQKRIIYAPRSFLYYYLIIRSVVGFRPAALRYE